MTHSVNFERNEQAYRIYLEETTQREQQRHLHHNRNSTTITSRIHPIPTINQKIRRKTIRIANPQHMEVPEVRKENKATDRSEVTALINQRKARRRRIRAIRKRMTK